MVEIKHGQVAAALDLHDTPAQGISCSRTNTLLLNPILTITEEWCHLWRLLLVCPTSGIHWYSSIMAVAYMWMLGFKDHGPPWGNTATVALMLRAPAAAATAWARPCDGLVLTSWWHLGTLWFVVVGDPWLRQVYSPLDEPFILLATCAFGQDLRMQRWCWWCYQPALW